MTTSVVKGTDAGFGTGRNDRYVKYPAARRRIAVRELMIIICA
jgi:hypothetical protein